MIIQFRPFEKPAMKKIEFNNETRLALANYTSGLMLAPLQLSGPEANRMWETMEGEDSSTFRIAIEEQLGFKFTLNKQPMSDGLVLCGVLHVTAERKSHAKAA